MNRDRERNADTRDWAVEWLLSIDQQRVGLESGYWWTVRAYEVELHEGQPYGLSYSITLHDPKGDRVLGFDNAHPVDVATGPARKSRRPVTWDHKHARGQRSVPYAFVSPARLVEDFFDAMNDYLTERGLA